jgi:tetratricopeptide (TPR) repeat protein
MKRSFTSPYLCLVACGVVSMLAGCNRAKTDRASETGAVSAEDSGKGTAATGSQSAAKGKVPVTTKSEEARRLYLKGLQSSDHLRFSDARQQFGQAVAKDPDFAAAHAQLAFNSTTPKEFRTHVDHAAALSGKVSEGERLVILSLQAGANADPAKSLEYLKTAVAKYPQDERLRLALAFAYSGRQDYENAIEHLKQAIEIAPDFSPAYNSLGYAYSSMDNSAEAEKAFKKYIELIPEDANPHDSYAELLMKSGRFDESVAQYRKALALDPHFTNSYYGIASNLMFQGKHDQAIAEAQKLANAAQTDGDRRLGMFTRTVVYLDQGKPALALKEVDKEYALDARRGDTAAMAGDAVTMGDILLNTGKPNESGRRYEQARSLLEKSGLSSEVKEDATLAHHYNLGRVALATNDLATAKSEAAEYLKGAEAKQNSARIQQGHELAGTIALKEKNFDQAISELEQGNQQDPYVVYVLALAYQGKGDKGKATELFKQSAESYTLPTVSYALIRAKAKRQSAAESTP